MRLHLERRLLFPLATHSHVHLMPESTFAPTTGRATLALLAPVTGVIVPLDEVPDPVFAQRLAGDGLSIDPLGSEVVAP